GLDGHGAKHALSGTVLPIWAIFTPPPSRERNVVILLQRSRVAGIAVNFHKVLKLQTILLATLVCGIAAGAGRLGCRVRDGPACGVVSRVRAVRFHAVEGGPVSAAPTESAVPPLRTWQRRALTRYLAARPADFLAVATPGAGKTAFALRVAAELIADRTVQAVTVVTPTEHLKSQWAAAAQRYGIALDPAFRNAAG